MKDIIIFFLCISILLYSCWSIADCAIPKNSPQYGYGKYFYGGKVNIRPEVYALNNDIVYNAAESYMNEPDEDMPNFADNVSVFMTAKLDDNHVIANVIINNDSDTTIYIPKKNIPNNGGIAGPNFKIHSECIYLDYLGPLVNFGGHYTHSSDYVTIGSGGSFSERIFLDQYFHFLPGRHNYIIEIPFIPISFKNKRKWIEVRSKSNQVNIRVDSLFLNKKIRATYCSGGICNNSVRWIVQKEDGFVYKKSGQRILRDSIWVPLVGFGERGRGFTKGQVLPQWESDGERYDVEWVLKTDDEK